MAIIIQTEQPVIPVEIGDLKFEFNISDESVLNFRKNAMEVQKELAGLDLEEDEDAALETSKRVLQRGYDFILGEGSFEKIYEVYPSSMILLNYLIQISAGIEKELGERQLSKQEKAIQKYTRKSHK